MHGIVFAGREARIERIRTGDRLQLIADPPGQEDPEVWVHLPTGEPIGHLPPEIGCWMAPWMRAGGSAVARVLRASGPDVPSWRRLFLEVDCLRAPRVPGATDVGPHRGS